MRVRSLWSMIVVASLALACKPSDDDGQPTPVTAEAAAEVFAQQICAGMFACDCPSAVESEAACVAELRSNIDSALQTRLGDAPVWNEDCAGQLVASWADWGCAGPSAALRTTDFDAESCPVIKGTKLAGAECSRFRLGDDCAPGSACVGNVCVETAVPIPSGQVCGFDWNEVPCVDGDSCTYDEALEAQICKPNPSVGDPCNPSYQVFCGPIAGDLLCGSTGVCEPRSGLGGPCTTEYLSCSPGLYCDANQDLSCQPQTEIGESCTTSAACPEDSACFGNICQPLSARACSLLFFEI